MVVDVRPHFPIRASYYGKGAPYLASAKLEYNTRKAQCAKLKSILEKQIAAKQSTLVDMPTSHTSAIDHAFKNRQALLK